MIMRKLAVSCLILISLAFVSCTSKPSTTEYSQPKKLRSIDQTTGATLTGIVKFTGLVPKAIPIDMSADPACKGQNVSEPIAAKNGNLANVFIYVKDGLGESGWAYPVPQVEIVQQGCKYVPHVVGIMTGQTVRIINADDTMHNIHPIPQHNHEWNAAQMSHGEPLLKKFDNPELMIPVKCNQHPWMKMYINVASNPFFAVTGDDGRFTLTGLPPGTYTIAAIHESLGEQTDQITVNAKETKPITFTFAVQNTAAVAK